MQIYKALHCYRRTFWRSHLNNYYLRVRAAYYNISLAQNNHFLDVNVKRTYIVCPLE